MASQVKICQRALQKIGAGTITSLEQDSREARACSRVFDTVRDAVLRAHPWNFAILRTNLAADPTAPDWGFDRRFQIPSDFLRLLEVRDSNAFPYEIESGYILTSAPAPLYIRYVRRITDTEQFDALFTEALACKLAFELAEELTQSATKKDQAGKEFEAALRQARNADAQESPPQSLGDTRWWDAAEFTSSGNNTLSR